MTSKILICVGFFVLTLVSMASANNLTTLLNACYQGDAYEVACATVNASLSSIPVPPGTSATCVWNPGGEHSCTAQVMLDVTSIVETMTQSAVIESMEFIQSGVATDNVIFYSDPFVPHQVHVTADGSLFPTATDPEFWMEVTSIDDITAQAFNLTSINPADIAGEQLAEIEAQYLGSGNITLGQGITPDLSVIKAFEEFTWNLTVSYDTEQYLVGIEACNGTFTDSCGGDWISLTECQVPGSCPDDTYLKDVPAAGLLTVYGVDPVPVYGDAVTTTTTVPACTGDTDGDGTVSDFELLDAIDDWASGTIDDFTLLDIIGNWSMGYGGCG